MNNQNVNRILAHIGIQWIIRYRFLWILLIAGFVFAASQGLNKLRMDSSNDSFLPESDQLSAANESFKKLFGNEEFIFILVESGDIFSPDSLSRLRQLQEDLEDHLPFIDDVTSITNTEYIDAFDDNLVIDDLISKKIPTKPEEIKQIKQKLIQSKMYVDRIISKDLKSTGIAITFRRIPNTVWVKAGKDFSPMDQAKWVDENIIMRDKILYVEPDEFDNPEEWTKVVDPRKLIAPAFNVILKKHQTADFTLTATGIPLGDFEGDRITLDDGSKIGLIALVTSFVFMLILFRNLAGVLAPICVILSTVTILFGLLGWMGIPLSMLTMIVAPLIMVLSISYSIHFINHFNFHFRNKGNRILALHYAYSQSTWPCLLTALTTAIGFTSFLIVSMKPIRDVGLACSVGVIISYLLVMILVPIGYSFGFDRVDEDPHPKKPKSVYPRGMIPLADWVSNHKLSIFIVALALSGVGIMSLPGIPIETDMLKIIGEQNSFVQDTKAVTSKLGGYYSYEVMIQLKNSFQADEPEIMNALDELSVAALKWPAARNTMSVVDLVKEINFVLHNRQDGSYKIPDSKKAIAQNLLLYSFSGGEELEKWIDAKHKTVRLSVQLNDSRNLTEHINQMQELSAQLFPEDAQIKFVGEVPILLKMMNLLNIGQMKSIGMAFVLICLIMILILGSVWAGLIAMIPNLFPLAVIAATMNLFNIDLDIMTIMIAPMIIGIAVDDTVHFFIHFKAELQGFRDYQRANQQTFVKIGHALLFTTVVLSIGFAILGFSSTAGIIHLSILSVVGIVSALIADFFIAPVLLTVIRPFGLFLPPKPA